LSREDYRQCRVDKGQTTNKRRFTRRQHDSTTDDLIVESSQAGADYAAGRLQQ
jgi:hypothetical protein